MKSNFKKIILVLEKQRLVILKLRSFFPFLTGAGLRSSAQGPRGHSQALFKQLDKKVQCSTGHHDAARPRDSGRIAVPAGCDGGGQSRTRRSHLRAPSASPRPQGRVFCDTAPTSSGLLLGRCAGHPVANPGSSWPESWTSLCRSHPAPLQEREGLRITRTGSVPHQPRWHGARHPSSGPSAGNSWSPAARTNTAPVTAPPGRHTRKLGRQVSHRLTPETSQWPYPEPNAQVKILRTNERYGHHPAPFQDPQTTLPKGSRKLSCRGVDASKAQPCTLPGVAPRRNGTRNTAHDVTLSDQAHLPPRTSDQKPTGSPAEREHGGHVPLPLVYGSGISDDGTDLDCCDVQ